MIVIRLDRRVLWGIVAVLLILVALGAGVLIGSLTSRGGSTAAAVPQAPVQQAPVQQPPVQQLPVQPQAQAQQPQAPTNLPMITVDEARQELGLPNVVFVDARVADEYKRGHIKGAISMPNTEVAQRLSELPKDKDLIIYCA